MSSATYSAVPASVRVAGRELRSLAVSPLAYAVGALYLAVSGLLFTSGLPGLTQARVDDWMSSATTLTLFLAPVVGMRAIAEERRSGTLEVLLSGPVTDAGVVLGKFAGLLAYWTALLGATLAYPALLSRWGSPDWGPIISGYLGLWLLGTACFAVSLLASALTRHQVVAAVCGFVVLLLLWVLDTIGSTFGGATERVLTQLALSGHVQPFLQGLVRAQDAVYYVSVATVSVFLAARALESRRWL
jgi:ABC-2 type transport system permease protein